MKTLLFAIITLSLGVLPPIQSIAIAQTGSAQSKSGKGANISRSEDQAIQRDRLDLEKKKFSHDEIVAKAKLDLEKSKLEIEQSKVRWSSLSTIIPLLGVLLTVIYSAWSFRKQTALQVAAQEEAAKLAFEIKAAEIAFAGKTPHAVANRGKALKALFKERLPEGFLTQFDPNMYGGDKESPDEKKFFLELLVKYLTGERTR